MEINTSKLYTFLVGMISLGFVSFVGYFFFTLFFSGATAETPSLTVVSNSATLGPKMQKAASYLVDPAMKISLSKKDIAFTESALFKSFTELPDSVSLSAKRGRPDPFTPPYATP